MENDIGELLKQLRHEVTAEGEIILVKLIIQLLLELEKLEVIIKK